VPLACVLAGIALSFATSAIDSATGYRLIPRGVTGSPAAAQTILSTVASAMVTLTSLTLSLTLVATSSRWACSRPRSRTRCWCCAVDDQRGAVPGVTILVANAFVLGCVVALILYVHAAGQSLRLSGLIDLVGDKLREQLDIWYPAEEDAAAVGGEHVILSAEPGSVFAIDERSLVAAAKRSECVLELVPAMGDFVPAGAPLFSVDARPDEAAVSEIVRLVALGPERTHDDDPA